LNLIEDHIQQVNLWLETLMSTADRFALIFHGDCDGVISAVMFDYILRETMAKTDIVLIPLRTEQYDFEQALNTIEETRPDASVFLDLSIQNHPEKLIRAANATKQAILIYDHHSQYSSDIPDKVLYLNPSITPNGYDDNSPPPCLFAARLAQNRIGRDFDWIACVGLIAEAAVDRYLPAFKKVAQQNPDLCPARGIVTPEDVYNCKLKDITYAVSAAFWGPPGMYEQMTFDILAQMVKDEAPQSFFSRTNADAKKLLQLETDVHAEINRLAAEAEFHCYYNSETGLRYAEIESIYRVGGAVASRLVRKHHKDIVVIGQMYSDRYVIEARSGSRRSINVADLLKNACAELNPYSTGGHPAAAGATLKIDSSSEFFIALENAVADV